jgi:DNA repair exonuclease SbcCD ATPase subunit
MTPMRTSSLKHIQEPSKTPHSSKENIRSRSVSPRKPLQEIPSNTLQPADLVKEDPEEFIEHSKRLFRNLQLDNEKLKSRIQNLEQSNSELASSKQLALDNLQEELEKLTIENHRLECLVQKSGRELADVTMSPRPQTANDEIRRLSDELAWHSKLHLYAEKERLRLLDLLEFAGYEGKFVVKEYIGLREKFSKISLRSIDSDGSGGKCLL